MSHALLPTALRLALAIQFLVLSGCAPAEDASSDHADEDPRPRFVWAAEQRPYDVVSIEEKNAIHDGFDADVKNTEVGVVHRYANVVHHGSLTRSDVEATAREVYEELRRDVDETCAVAPYKLVIVRIYYPQQEPGKDHPLLLALSGSVAAKDLPTWSRCELRWMEKSTAEFLGYVPIENHPSEGLP